MTRTPRSLSSPALIAALLTLMAGAFPSVVHAGLPQYREARPQPVLRNELSLDRETLAAHCAEALREIVRIDGSEDNVESPLLDDSHFDELVENEGTLATLRAGLVLALQSRFLLLTLPNSSPVRETSARGFELALNIVRIELNEAEESTRKDLLNRAREELSEKSRGHDDSFASETGTLTEDLIPARNAGRKRFCSAFASRYVSGEVPELRLLPFARVNQSPRRFARSRLTPIPFREFGTKSRNVAQTSMH